jgi:hypothetical protein
MYLASGYNPQYLMSGRQEMEVLHHNYYMCYENVGDNIQAILNPECNTTKLQENKVGIQFLLRNLTIYKTRRNKGTIANRIDYDTPYFMYENIDNDTIGGEILLIGSYQLISYPTNNEKRGKDRMNLQMIICAYYRPLNECRVCTQQETCEWSQCVTKSPNGVRILLLTYGQDTYDFDMNITSPFGSTMNAYYNTDRIDYQTSDLVTGGYVERDYMMESCRSTGVWIKNIIYPTYIPGTYSMTLRNVLKCSFLGPPFFGGSAPPNKNCYEIRIYKKEKALYTSSSDIDPTRRIITYTLQ